MKDVIFYVMAIFTLSGSFYALYLTREIKVKQRQRATSNIEHRTLNIDLSGTFAVSDQEPWWRAVHQIIDQAEAETILGARAVTHDANRCIAAVGSGEGCALIRTKLKEARDYALSSYRGDIKAK